jgi:hypothetical protein
MREQHTPEFNINAMPAFAPRWRFNLADRRLSAGRRAHPMRAKLALRLAMATLPSVAFASDPLVADLEQRLSNSGVESVNAYLNAHWAAAMSPLNHKTASCELRAVSLAVRLSRSTNARAAQAHGESLRAATGRCAAVVLALVTPREIPRVCASVASWGPAQTARELRRRINDIDSDEQLRSNRRTQACRAAYVYELENTRVVVKGAAPDARRPGK